MTEPFLHIRPEGLSYEVFSPYYKGLVDCSILAIRFYQTVARQQYYRTKAGDHSFQGASLVVGNYLISEF